MLCYLPCLLLTSFFLSFLPLLLLLSYLSLSLSLSLSLPACGRKAPAAVRRSQVNASLGPTAGCPVPCLLFRRQPRPAAYAPLCIQLMAGDRSPPSFGPMTHSTKEFAAPMASYMCRGCTLSTLVYMIARAAAYVKSVAMCVISVNF